MIQAKESIDKLKQNIESVIIGKSRVIEQTIITLIAQGHLLIEDVPGVGKSSLAYRLARSMNLDVRATRNRMKSASCWASSHPAATFVKSMPFSVARMSSIFKSRRKPSPWSRS